jgi:1-phosphofructokinase family hexose kinase
MPHVAQPGKTAHAVLVIGPNLSIDQTVAVPRLLPGTVHRVPSILRLAGGKGTNVARALQTLGEEPLLCGFVGGATGNQLAAYLRAEGIAHRLVPIAGETRVCFSIADDESGEQTEFYEAGPPIAARELATLIAMAEACLEGKRWAVLTGSVPLNAPDALYARLIASARERGVRTLLDARGKALVAGVAERPDVLKVNRLEAGELLGRPLSTPGDAAEAAERLVERMRGGAAIITLGALGAALASEDGRWRVSPPHVQARSPVGSGDSTAAGIVAGMLRNLPLLEAARWGIAAGTASALHLGAARFTRRDVEKALEGCTVTPLDGRSRPNS